MASSTPSAPTSEITAKPHPYQIIDEHTSGPKGAYEARQFNNGLYVRVDMPGVPSDGVKVVKYNDTRTITFTGKAPTVWPGFDTGNTRVYSGYVVLDRDPSDVDFSSEVEDGVFRLYFPGCDGSLHFLSPPRGNAAVVHDAERSETVQDEVDELNGESTVSFILHSPLQPYGIELAGRKPEDVNINPHLLSGVKGVYEQKIVPINPKEHLIYVRLDCPSTCRKGYLILEDKDSGIMFQAMTFVKKDPRYGESRRRYFSILKPSCNCCRYQVVKHDTTDGVMRSLVRKSDNLYSPSVCHCTMPPARPGGDLQPTSLLIIENVRH